MNIRNTLMAAGTAATMMVGGATKAVAQEVQPRAVRQITTTAADTLKKADQKVATFDILSRIDSIARSQADSIAVAKSDSVQARKPLFSGYFGAKWTDYMKDGAGITMGGSAKKGKDTYLFNADYVGKHHNAVMGVNMGYNRDVYTFVQDSTKNVKAFLGTEAFATWNRNHTYLKDANNKSVHKHDQFATLYGTIKGGISAEKNIKGGITLSAQVEGGPAYGATYVGQTFDNNKHGQLDWFARLNAEARSSYVGKKHNQLGVGVQYEHHPSNMPELGINGHSIKAYGKWYF